MTRWAMLPLLALPSLAACQVYGPALLTDSDGGLDTGADACLSTCGGKCADLQNEKANCGKCGHACEVGCAQGLCTPTLLANGLGAPHGILVDPANLYVANRGAINVQVMSNVDGTGLKNLASAQVFPDRLTSDGTTLYWSNDSDPVGSVNYVVATGGQWYIAARDLPLPYGVVTRGGYLFITTTDTTNASPGCAADAWTMSVLRCPTNNPGCYVTACNASGGPTVLASQQATPAGIAVDANNVYWANSTGGTVMFCPQPDCNGGAKPFAQGLGKPWEVASDGAAVYITDRSGSLLTCAPTGCGSSPGVLATGLADPLLIAVDTGAVYFTEYAAGAPGKGKLSRCVIPQCTGGPEVLATGLNAPYGVVVDSTYVYWSEEGTGGFNSNDGKVSKLRKN